MSIRLVNQQEENNKFKAQGWHLDQVKNKVQVDLRLKLWKTSTSFVMLKDTKSKIKVTKNVKNQGY